MKNFFRVITIIFLAMLVILTAISCPKKGSDKSDSRKSRPASESTATTKSDTKPDEKNPEVANVKVNLDGVWDVYSIIESDTSGNKTPGTEMPGMVWHIRMKDNYAIIEPEGSDEVIKAKIVGLNITAKPENTEPWYDISGTIAPEGNFMHGTNKSMFEENGVMHETLDSWTAIKRDTGEDTASSDNAESSNTESKNNDNKPPDEKPNKDSAK